VICFQILVSYLTRKIPAFSAMTLGLLIMSLSWLILAFHPTTVGFIVTLVVLAFGEITQSARYYEYISRLAPSGQQGLYMGYAFLPIAIGYFIAGPLGGYLLHYFGDVVHRPQQMWWVVTGVGIAGAVLMVVYDRVFKPGEGKGGRQAA
jgi:MFS family permease